MFSLRTAYDKTLIWCWCFLTYQWIPVSLGLFSWPQCWEYSPHVWVISPCIAKLNIMLYSCILCKEQRRSCRHIVHCNRKKNKVQWYSPILNMSWPYVFYGKYLHIWRSKGYKRELLLFFFWHLEMEMHPQLCIRSPYLAIN